MKGVLLLNGRSDTQWSCYGRYKITKNIQSTYKDTKHIEILNTASRKAFQPAQEGLESADKGYSGQCVAG